MTSTNDLIAKFASGEKFSTSTFHENANNFIQKLNTSVSDQSWSDLIKQRYEEVSIYLDQMDISDEDELDEEDSEIKFSLFLNEDSKLHCSVEKCKSRFGHKRSYEFHMQSKHKGIPVDHSKKDPSGMCLLFSTKRKGPCHAKLPLRSIYHHMEKIHGIKRTGNDILMGFDITDDPKPIFCKKGGDLDRKYLKALRNTNQKVIGDQVEEEGQLTQTPKKNMDKDSYPTAEINSEDCSGNNGAENISAVEEMNNNPILSKEDLIDSSQSENSSLENTFTDTDSCDELDYDHLSPCQSNDLDYIPSPNKEFEFKVPEIPKKRRKKNKSSISGEHIAEANTSQSSNFDGESYSASSAINMNVDSDYEDNDTTAFTKKRRENKQNRYLQRNTNVLELHELEENKTFIEDMRSYMEKNVISTANTKTPTIDKTVRYLFTKPDSFLNYEYKKNNNFSLENLRNFNESSFQHLSYPLDWILSSAETETSTLGVERLKAHADLREFLEYEVSTYDNSEGFARMKNSVRENLDSITKQISKNKLFKKYNTVTAHVKQKTDRCKMILQPSTTVNVEKLAKTWNASHEKVETEKDYEFIFESAMAENDIGVKNLTKYAQYARICLLLR